MNNFQQQYELLSSTKIGIEYEFYTSLKLKDVSKSLSKFLGKKIVIPVFISGFNETDKGTYHSDLEPTANMFKIERDFSGGKDMLELISGPMPYDEARIIIIKVLQWIKQNGWTDGKSSIHLNVSFNQFKARLKNPLMNLNILKFILGFDESFIYSRFPNRKDSVYAKSIHNIYPLNRFIFFDKPENIDRTNFIVPHEKYFGVNFTKLPKNYLELRYLGGEGYENKTSKILEVLDYFIIQLYSTLQNGESYTEIEKSKLHDTLIAQKKVVETFSDPEKFLITYPNIFITVDMNGSIEILKAYWLVIRDKLFSLICDSGLRKGYFNLDTEVSIFQLREGKMKRANNIEEMELFDCEISGTINKCHLFRCKINSSRLNECKLIEGNEVENSKIESSTISPDNIIKNCYINNPSETTEGKIIGGVIRKAIIGRGAQISDHTLIVDAKYSGDKKDSDSLQNAFFKKDAKKDNESYTNIYKNHENK